MVLPLNPFQLIPAQRCRGVQFFWQLQLFGRVLPAPPIAGCQPWRGEAERWASPINEVDKLTTNLRKKITGRLRSRWYIVDQAVPGSGLRLLVAIERQCVYDNDFHHQWTLSASGAALPLAGWVGRLIRASQDSDTPLAYWPNTREQSILSVIEYIYMQISIRHPPGYFYSHKSMCPSKGRMKTQASLAFYERWHASTWNFVLLVFPSQDIWFSQQPRICSAPILADHQAQQTILHHQTIPDLTHLSSYYPHIQRNNQLKLYWYKNARVGSRFKSEHLCVAFFLGCQPFIYQPSIHRAAASAPSSFCQSITSKAAIIALFGPNR